MMLTLLSLILSLFCFPLSLQALCANVASSKGSSKVLKEKKELIDWVAFQIKKIYAVSPTHGYTQVNCSAFLNIVCGVHF